jgi:superfamily I DNA/RNA helicase
MTRQIHEALNPLRNEVNRVRSNQEETAKPIYTGSKPRWLRADPPQHYRIIANDILEQIKTHGTHPGQFAVLFHTNEELRRFHASQGERLATCVHNNRGSFSIDQPAVHLLTAHNAKGLEFPHVYLPHVLSLAAPRGGTGNRFDLVEQIDSGIKLLYVACSRASSTLTILQESTQPIGPLGLLKITQWIHNDLTVTMRSS